MVPWGPHFCWGPQVERHSDFTAYRGQQHRGTDPSRRIGRGSEQEQRPSLRCIVAAAVTIASEWSCRGSPDGGQEDGGDEEGLGDGADRGLDGDPEGVWSPDIEQSFQEALAIYPPCGRRKIILSDEGKMYGRNELIARYIKLRTGKTRTRKQVSSHLQVLARRKSREIQSKLKDQASKDKALQTVANLSSAQIVSASVLKAQAPFPPPVRFWPGPIPGQPGHSQDIKPFAQPPYTTLPAPVPAPISYEPLPAPRPVAIAAPVWLNRTIASDKLRLLEYSAFMETQRDSDTHKHLFVHIGQSNPSYSDPVLESVDVRQIYDKFPERKGGLKELYEKGPQDAFFLVKFWADLSPDGDEGSAVFYGVSSQYSGSDNITITVSTKVCSFGKQVVEKVETEYAQVEGGKCMFRRVRSEPRRGRRYRRGRIASQHTSPSHRSHTTDYRRRRGPPVDLHRTSTHTGAEKMAEPLHSATASGNTEDTSLEVPSDNRQRTGQQRVLDQVHTIKRSKSKHGKNQGTGQPESPSTLKNVSAFADFGYSKVPLATTNGVMNRSATLVSKSSGGGGYSKTRATGQTIRNNRSSMHSVHTNNFQTHVICLPSTRSESKGSLNRLVKVEQDQSMQNSETSMANMTLKDAVDLLSHSEENFQHCGASFIQHCTFKEEGPKHEVLNLGGIPALVALLQSPNPDVSRSASAALRNLVFKDEENKKVVQQIGGIANAVQLLKETDSTETQKQLTGLLWNLSSADEQKKELIELALPVLTENVVVPFNCWSENSANNNIHPEVFYNATGCLRNLSCAQNKKERQTMRDCHGLIDSLMTYIDSCVADDNPDDKSVENCACILHNLSYQLEAESPVCFSKFNPAEAPGAQKDTTVGCFSPKSSKLHKEHVFDMNKSMKDDSVPSGVNWLCHPKTMQTYMTLLGTSQKDSTREACCGALQNLTAHSGPGASAISQILVQKMSALLTITPLLRSPNQTLQKTAMSLMGNMARSSSLKSSIAKEVLPDLASILSSGRREMGNRDDTITTTCNNMRSLLFADSDVSKKILTPDLVTSLADLSENISLPKGSKAASLLLYSMWNEKSLQGTLKKLNLSKSLFVNDITTAVYKSVQVIE
ncbi:unnamed protein product [Merluccius merluccius]